MANAHHTAEVKRGFGPARIACISVLALLGVGGLLISIGLMEGFKKHARYDCQLQLGRIGVLTREFASAHNGRFPNNWIELESFLPSTNWHQMFICPSTGHSPEAWDRAATWVDYRLIAGRTTNQPPETILAIEPLSNHRSGANAQFIDGRTMWIPAGDPLRALGIDFGSPNKP